VLRYIHDVNTGKFFHVGLAQYYPAMHYANAACRTTSKRLTPLFPSLDSSVFRALMRKVQTRFEAFHKGGWAHFLGFTNLLGLQPSWILREQLHIL
jgi:hypothetical protein